MFFDCLAKKKKKRHGYISSASHFWVPVFLNSDYGVFLARLNLI